MIYKGMKLSEGAMDIIEEAYKLAKRYESAEIDRSHIKLVVDSLLRRPIEGRLRAVIDNARLS